MVCPRCGGSLVQYQLGDSATVSCQACAYVGVSVDHRPESEQSESWDEALGRFYDQYRIEQGDSDAVENVPTDEGESASEETASTAEESDIAAEEAPEPTAEERTEPNSDESATDDAKTDSDGDQAQTESESTTDPQPAESADSGG